MSFEMLAGSAVGVTRKGSSALPKSFSPKSILSTTNSTVKSNGLGNPFKGKTFDQIDIRLTLKDFSLKGQIL